MSVDAETVVKMAKLARLQLREDEITLMTVELNGLLKWVERLSEVDTSGVPQMFGHSGIELPMRADTVTDGGKLADILKNAPNAEHGCFAVPKVVE